MNRPAFIQFRKGTLGAGLASMLEQHADNMAREALELYDGGQFTPWPEQFLHTGGWSVFGVRWQGQAVNPGRAPYLAGVVSEYGLIVRNAGYSAMMPHTEIREHVGYTSDVIRVHCGLVVPFCHRDRCHITVGERRRTWKKGEIMAFDDTLPHSAYNSTSEVRIVALLDVERRYYDMPV